MNILIISIDHFIQKARGRLNSPTLLAQKDKLEALIRAEISRRGVEFIGEESNPKFLTIAKQIADSLKPQIPWENIDMPDDAREEARILEASKARPIKQRQTELGYVEIEHRIPEDHIRELFMVKQALAKADGKRSILILCGDMHTEALASKFREEGHRVDTNDEMCPDKWWLPER